MKNREKGYRGCCFGICLEQYIFTYTGCNLYRFRIFELEIEFTKAEAQGKETEPGIFLKRLPEQFH